MRKLNLLLVVMALMFTLIMGCSGAGSNTQESSAAVGDTATPAAEPAKEVKKDPVTLKFYSWYRLQDENFDKVLDAFHATHPDIKVEFINLSEKSDATEYLKKLDLAAASGDDMDVIMFSNAQSYSQRVSAGLTAPLDEFIAKEGLNLQDEYKFDTKIDGKTHALPGKFIDWFVMINKNHLDEAGLPVPTDWTWDQFAEYAKAMTKGEGASKRYGTYFHSWPDFFQLAQANAPENNGLITADGKPNIDTPRIRKSLEILNQSMNVGKYATPYVDIISQKLAYRNMYFGEQASMIVIGNWMIPEAAGSDKVPANFKTVFAPYPKHSADDVNGMTPAGGDFISIAEKSKHKEEAYTFARWLSTEGLLVSGKFISSWKKADLDSMLQTAAAQGKSPEMVDIESLKNVMNVSKGAGMVGLQPYYGEASKAYVAEAEKFILGDTNLDQTIEAATKKVQELIDANK